MQYERRRINDVYVWLPAGVSANMSHYVSQLKTKATKINQIKELFKYKTCRLSRQSMHVIAGFSRHHSGGLDQAFSLTLAVAWKVLFLEIDLEINNEQLAKGNPCQTTLSNAEYRCASGCFLMVVKELKYVNLMKKTAWGDKAFAPLQHIIHTIIAIQSTQNQQVENYVQLAAFVRETNCVKA
jgi:hypothetical protein